MLLNQTKGNGNDSVTWGGGNGNGQQPVSQIDPLAEINVLKAQISALERQVKMAKGTQDIVPPAEAKPKDLAAKITHALRGQILTTDELARSVGEPANKVQAKIKEIRKALADVGHPEQARWTLRLGDETSAKELRDVVVVLIKDQPMTTAELVKATGARMSRVNGVLVDIQRAGKEKIFNLGSDYRARWFILPEGAKDARLPPKVVKK